MTDCGGGVQESHSLRWFFVVSWYESGYCCIFSQKDECGLSIQQCYPLESLRYSRLCADSSFVSVAAFTWDGTSKIWCLHATTNWSWQVHCRSCHLWLAENIINFILSDLWKGLNYISATHWTFVHFVLFVPIVVLNAAILICLGPNPFQPIITRILGSM